MQDLTGWGLNSRAKGYPRTVPWRRAQAKNVALAMAAELWSGGRTEADSDDNHGGATSTVAPPG